MKNMYKLISVLLISIMLLCSCSTEVVIPKTKLPISTPTQEPIPTAEETPVPTKIGDIGQIVYPYTKHTLCIRNSCNYNYDHKFDRYGAISIQEEMGWKGCVVDDSVPKKITWNYLGVDFELDYVCSGYDGECDISDNYADAYLDPSNYLRVAFFHGTLQPLWISYSIEKKGSGERTDPLKHIVSYNNIEEDYINVIELNNQYFSKDFTGYDLECVITYEDKELTYTKLEDVKSTGSEVDRLSLSYSPKKVSGLEVKRYPKFYICDFWWTIYYGETNFDKYSKPADSIEITDPELWYAYEEARKFAETHYRGDFKTSYIYDEQPFLPDETLVEVINGKIYLYIKLRVIEHDFDGHYYNTSLPFYVDYQRLQWKMALEGK